MPTVAMHREKYFQHIREKYNSIYKEELPLITPHVCSHMASAGINPKHLQYLMGHSDLSVTMNTYTHAEYENVEKELNSYNAPSCKFVKIVLFYRGFTENDHQIKWQIIRKHKIDR